jgi:hypothetical protein
MFQFGEVLLEPLRSALRGRAQRYEFTAPRLNPAAGAALYAARLAGAALTAAAVDALARECAPSGADGAAP